MIKNSFIFLDKIGHKREKQIWNEGINDWEEFKENKEIKSISFLRKPFYDRQIERAENALKNENILYLKNIFPSSEQWRLYNTFREDAVFLDIETTGFYGNITVIGLYDGENTKTLVRGFNLDKDLLKNELKNYKLILTFNGASFDLPVVKKYFGNIIPEIPHIDLRFVCSKIGLKGGLKVIEKILNIKRPEEIENIAGDDAVMLWEMYKATGNRKYLDSLILYNEQDIVNLKQIADYSTKELWKKVKNQ